MSERIKALRSKMTAREKANFVAGTDIWHAGAVERLGIGTLKVTDGPNGARGVGLMGTGTPTACIPSGAVLGAAWDPDLVYELGSLLGEESLAKGAHVLLAPTVNLHRSPKGGRNFECYSEDPLLSGRIAAAFVRGVQSHSVGVTVKHFVANDSEFERKTIDTQIDERTLREVALLPFEIAVKEGGAWGVMSAYNRLNGTYCSEHHWLLHRVLRQEWGFDGIVVTDWFADGSTVGAVGARMTLEMPGPGRFYGESLFAALQSGEVAESEVDLLVEDLLRLMERTGVLDSENDFEENDSQLAGSSRRSKDIDDFATHNTEDIAPNDAADTPVGATEGLLDRPADRELIRRAAAAGTVLLTNNGILPLDPAQIGSIAVIGPNARQAKIMGGGSATVRAYHETTPLDALRERLPNHQIRYAVGADIDRTVTPITRPMLTGMARIEYRNGWAFDGVPDVVVEETKTSVLAFGAPAEGINSDHWSARITATIVAEVDGPHRFTLTESGRAILFVDGKVVVDATATDIARGDSFFGFGSTELSEVIDLVAGRPTELRIDYTNVGAVLLAGVVVGVRPIAKRDLRGEAARLASDCDAAIVIVGTNDDWETEGRDRDLWELPGAQGELIGDVAAANPKTIVIMNVGSAHSLDWIDQPAAVLSVGFGGQEMAEAIVDMLIGDVEPGGRSPTTIGARYEHFGAYINYPGENSVVRYGESIYCGHRWHDALGIEPTVAFGSGLGYTTFDIGDIASTASIVAGEPLNLDVTVTNTGERHGSEVVQAYVEPVGSTMRRPVRELKAFAKTAVDPGKSSTVTLKLDARAFAYFDPADPVWPELSANTMVPAGTGGLHRDTPGWYVDEGTYVVRIGRSSREFAGSCLVTVNGNIRLDP